jgi:hypothetical protein
MGLSPVMRAVEQTRENAELEFKMIFALLFKRSSTARGTYADRNRLMRRENIAMSVFADTHRLAKIVIIRYSAGETGFLRNLIFETLVRQGLQPLSTKFK